jgi:hypothetical protein
MGQFRPEDKPIVGRLCFERRDVAEICAADEHRAAR